MMFFRFIGKARAKVELSVAINRRLSKAEALYPTNKIGMNH